MSTELQRAVVVRRERERILTAEKEAAYSEFQKLPANIQLFNALAAAKAETAKAENELREAGLKEYEATKNKQPFPGVGIRVREKVVYELKLALAWANEHHQALTLNAKEFEAIVKAMAVVPSFVTLEEETTATIATDLGGVLEGVGE